MAEVNLFSNGLRKQSISYLLSDILPSSTSYLTFNETIAKKNQATTVEFSLLSVAIQLRQLFSFLKAGQYGLILSLIIRRKFPVTFLKQWSYNTLAAFFMPALCAWRN